MEIISSYYHQQNIERPQNVIKTNKLLITAPSISDDVVDKYGVTGHLPSKTASTLNEFMDTLDIKGASLTTPLLAGSIAAVKYFDADNRLMLLVDRYGVNSIYYSVFDGLFCFSDRLDLLLNITQKGNVRREGIIEWCHLGTPLPPYTLFDNISIVSASKVLTVNLDTFEIDTKRYFNPVSMVDKNLYERLKKKSVADLEDDIETRLDTAVQESLSGAKEASILLSGGVDSSTMAAVCARHAKVHAITVDIEGDSELEFAKRAADHLNIELAVCKFGKTEFTNYFVDGVYNLGTPPIIENGIALQYLASQGHLEKDRIVLDGEGADALFYGSTPLFKSSIVSYLLSQYLPFGSTLADKGLPSISKMFGWLGMAQKTAMDRHGLDTMLGSRMRRFARYLSPKLVFMPPFLYSSLFH